MTENTTIEKEYILERPEDEVALLGVQDQFVTLLEEGLNVTVKPFGNSIKVAGAAEAVDQTLDILRNMSDLLAKGIKLNSADVVSAMKMADRGTLTYFKDLYTETLINDAKGRPVRVKNFGQRQYIDSIKHNDVTFGIGPAGTGKTYLAVVMAVSALKHGDVEKLIITRPAVEAGESLGFLPGDLKEKVDPYLRPIYDALYAILGAEHTTRLMDRGAIEIAPLAYMRGRTLESAFVILDEAQNTTNMQMKMFLTRLGFGSKMIVNGDISQIDLPHNTRSGLVQAQHILQNVAHINFVTFSADDVVRHPVVASIINAYEANETKPNGAKKIMDLEIYDKTQDGVPAEHVNLIQDVLQYAGKYLKLADNTEMSVTLMNNEDIHRINQQYRGVDRATDVISFAIEDDDEEAADFPLVMDDELAAEIPENIGDIFVSMDKVAEQADYLGHSYERELGFLVVHGFLHLNGYDHMEPEDEKVMFKLQADILDAYGLKR